MDTFTLGLDRLRLVEQTKCPDVVVVGTTTREKHPRIAYGSNAVSRITSSVIPPSHPNLGHHVTDGNGRAGTSRNL